jgi:hypothetical protein
MVVLQTSVAKAMRSTAAFPREFISIGLGGRVLILVVVVWGGRVTPIY